MNNIKLQIWWTFLLSNSLLFYSKFSPWTQKREKLCCWCFLLTKNKLPNQASLIVSELYCTWKKGWAHDVWFHSYFRFKLSCVCQCYFVWNFEKVQSRLRNCPAMLHNGCIACVLSKYLYRKITFKLPGPKGMLLFSSFAPKVWTAVAFTNTQIELETEIFYFQQNGFASTEGDVKSCLIIFLLMVNTRKSFEILKRNGSLH